MEKIERNNEWAVLFRSGMTFEAIGSRYGVSRERVRQVLARKGVRRYDGGKHFASASKKLLDRVEREATRNQRCFDSFGCCRSTAKSLNSGMSLRKGLALAYVNQRNAAVNTRGIEWKLTFPEWVEVWRESGKLNERGCKTGQYVMARRMDTGAYEAGNVYVTTCSDNIKLARALEKAEGRGRHPQNMNTNI